MGSRLCSLTTLPLSIYSPISVDPLSCAGWWLHFIFPPTYCENLPHPQPHLVFAPDSQGQIEKFGSCLFGKGGQYFPQSLQTFERLLLLPHAPVSMSEESLFTNRYPSYPLPGWFSTLSPTFYYLDLNWISFAEIRILITKSLVYPISLPVKVGYNNILKHLISYCPFGDHQEITCGKQGGLTRIDRCSTIPDSCILPLKYLFGFRHETVTVKSINITIFIDFLNPYILKFYLNAHMPGSGLKVYI